MDNSVTFDQETGMANSIQIRMAKQSETNTVGSMVYKLVMKLFPELLFSFDREKMTSVASHLLR
jgi:hypothetical protein